MSESQDIVNIRSREVGASNNPRADSANGSSGISRRKFLQILGASSAAGLAGCAEDVQQVIYPNVRGQVEQIPGVAVWYSSTCGECTAGCGIRVRTREGRAVKVEGNPDHPVNKGGLCALGQSSLQSLYDPDRVREPLKRVAGADGRVSFEPVSWDEAYATVSAALAEGDSKDSSRRVFLSGEVSGALAELIEGWCGAFKAEHVVYDPLQPVGLARASELVYGVRGIPEFHFDRAEVALNFGADIFETFVSPVQFARGWAKTRTTKKPIRVIHVEPRLSLSGASADTWLMPKPGTEVLLAMAVLKKVIEGGAGQNLAPDIQAGIKQLTASVDVDVAALAAACGVPLAKVLKAAHYLLSAKRSVVVAGGAAASSEKGLELQIVCCLLNLALGNVGAGADGASVDLARVRVPRSDPSRITQMADEMRSQKIAVAFVHGTNPSFSLPGEVGFGYALKYVPLVVSFSSHLDETARAAHLILPAHTALESWGDVRTYEGAYSLQQPVMKPVFATRALGDMLIDLAVKAGKAIRAADGSEAKDFKAFLTASWRAIAEKHAVADSFDSFWKKSLERGGYFRDSAQNQGIRVKIDRSVFGRTFEAATFGNPFPQEKSSADDIVLLPYPSVKSFDGRAANRPWLQELADPITQIVWDSWAEVHPETAKRIGVKQGDMLTVRNFSGELNIPVVVTPYVSPEIVAVPLGQGHTSYGRYAQKVGGGNVYALLPRAAAAEGDGLRLASTKVRVLRSPGKATLVTFSGSDSQMARDIARTTVLAETASGGLSAAKHDAPEHEHDVKQMYEQRKHPLYQWGMAVDLAACTGCSACVVACYAENNIPVVGKERCDEGREMAWLRIERYFDGKNFDNKSEEVPAEELSVSFLPMMCQQCQNAPCEPVCPVYATYHNEEGLNAMIYNRCVGTRYCSNNCTYKVRRFNWYDYQVPEPLNWQLNPDVTKRIVGIMEKCTFCVQRITEAKDHAKDEGRMVADGEVQPACVQSCPTQALSFGNLKDPNSRVSKLAKHTRAYKVLDYYINTQPSVTYLERIRYAKT